MVVKSYKINSKVDNFLRGWILPDLTICDDLIEFFEKSENKIKGGFIGGQNKTLIDTKIKDCLEINFPSSSQEPIWLKYVENLYKTLDLYIEEFPAANTIAPFGIIESTNIQYYPPGGGYKSWHCERTGAEFPFCTRHLVFMTYLNDLHEGGETEFLYQKVLVQPKKGLTLIWPADWTYLHRGIVSYTEKKYIITGWLNFYVANDQ